MKNVKSFGDFLNEAENKTEKTYLYLAGLVEKGDDDWVWQGYAVAPNKSAAKSMLADLVKSAGLNLNAVVDQGPEGKAEKVNSKNGVGIFDTTDYEQIVKGKSKPLTDKTLKKAIKNFDDSWRNTNLPD